MISQDPYIERFEVGDFCQWIGSAEVAPGPGRLMPAHKWLPVRWELWGEVIGVSSVDEQSITVRWDNGRVTIERARNLQHPILMAAA